MLIEMIAQCHSATISGIEAYPIVVELDLQGGIQDGDRAFILVGLPEKSVQESRERVRTAIKNSGMDFPNRKVMCNLAPGDLPKDGPWLDLPMAVAICAASGQVARHGLESTLMIGELGLDGTLRPIDGVVNVALMAMEKGFKRLIVPIDNASEASVATGVDVYGVRTLLQAVELLNGSDDIQPWVFDDSERARQTAYDVDYCDVKGQKHAVRALEIAAAGGHNMLMTGPPGSGKTMLARRLPTILPPLSLEESISVTRIHSATGEKRDHPGLIWDRPFRAPHHTASHVSIVGGGRIPRPGEISKAHLGVLFLDEMPEFDRQTLEALRQPLEDSIVTVARASGTMTFPAQCILIGAMNPCPCGFKGLPEEKCVSSPAVCARYASKLSGPLMDRIDLHIDVPRLKPNDLIGAAPGEPSAAIRERVIAARQRQDARLGHHRVNAKMSPKDIRELVPLDGESEEFMKLVSAKMNLSARVFDRLLKVGRTIADLAGEDRVSKKHLAEAVQYRERTGI